ncbi:MAG: AAA family ATPase [Methylobacter sp.]|nr:AAA family ATPase [Methylobacter sp.]MDP2426971.1 AAA family ATPase [Methylobacter sp.]MDP3056172.1 AAA family ATPase [Methylobacter sp.]MDP3360621.1 AAA family ATPase [Methylobacter sp.]MDZ4219558.1 AAA family ATPase [Methylobacter sp.]
MSLDDMRDEFFNTGAMPKFESFGATHLTEPNLNQRRSKYAFTFADAAELMARSYRSDYLIKTLFEKNTLGQIFGATGGGKSFVVLDAAYCIATGIPFHGLEVQQGNVAYICGEGFRGIGKRIKALQNKYGKDVTGKLFISEQPGAFIDDSVTEDVATAIKDIGGVSLVIIDTYHRNMGGGNENSADDFGLVLRHIDKHLKPLNVAVLIVHHSGHMDTDRSRGSSAIRAAMDFEYQVSKNGDSVTMKPTKIKDGVTPAPLFFTLVDSEIGIDESGEVITSAYLETKEGGDEPKATRRKLSARDDAILTSLDEAIAAHGVEPSPDIKSKFAGFDALFNKDRKVAHVDHWRELAYKTITVDGDGDKGDALKKAFKRTREKLADNRAIVVYGDFAWRLYDEISTEGDRGQEGGQNGTTCPPINTG